MTVRKTDEDLNPTPPKNGPEVLGENLDKDTVEALKRGYPNARQIEKLASGNYAIRFMRKPTIYKRMKR